MQTLTPSLQILSIALGIIAALLTNIVTKAHAASTLKAFVHLVISIGAGALDQALAAHGAFTVAGWLTAAWTAFLAGVVAHKSELIAPLTGSDGLLTKTFGGVGLGSDTPAVPPEPNPVAAP